MTAESEMHGLGCGIKEAGKLCRRKELTLQQKLSGNANTNGQRKDVPNGWRENHKNKNMPTSGERTDEQMSTEYEVICNVLAMNRGKQAR